MCPFAVESHISLALCIVYIIHIYIVDCLDNPPSGTKDERQEYINITQPGSLPRHLMALKQSLPMKDHLTIREFPLPRL